MMLPGDRVGPLRIERLLGAGGMGEVYLAHDARLERPVALKLLTLSDARERMLREARAASALRHPGIVTIYDIGEHDGQTYIAMEYVEGKTFEALVAQRGPLAVAEAVELLAQVGDALATAHEAGVLHRDIKSANLMVDEHGRTRVLDFGLCKLTRVNGADDNTVPQESKAARVPPSVVSTAHGKGQVPGSDRRPDLEDPREPAEVEPAPSVHESTPSELRAAAAVSPGAVRPGSGARSPNQSDEPQTELGASMGTPGWAPPELMEGRPADARSDVYSLGVVLYHLLTARMPFPGHTWALVRAQVMQGPVPPSRLGLKIPPALYAVILSALAVDPDRRPASVREFVARARTAILGRRRRRGWWAVLGAIAAGAAIVVAQRSRAASDPRAPAPAPATATIDASPSAPARLTAIGGCAFSPVFVDRDTVAFDLMRDGAVDLYRIGLGGTAPIRLTSDPGWEWRPGLGRRDGEVVFMRHPSPARPTDDGTLESLDLVSGVRSVVLDRSVVFAFSGDTLYYSPGGELRRRRDQHDEVMLVLPTDEFVHSIAASRDGSRLALVVRSRAEHSKVCVVATDTAQISCPAMPAGIGRTAFSPDMSAVYLDRGGGIDRLRLAGEVREVALPKVNPRGGIAVSPDGSAMVWSDCGATSDLIDVSTDPPRTLTSGARMWSPTFGPGGRLAYVRDRDGASQLIVRDPDGTDRELVNRTGARIGDVAFSPDGERMAFVLEDEQQPGIYLASLRELVPANRLTEDAGDTRPFFVGNELVFTRRDRDRVPHLMEINTDGSNVRVVSRRPRLSIGVDWVGHRVLLISPDREWLYWWDPVTERETPGPPANPANLPGVDDVSLSSDGRWLLYLGGNNGQESWRLRLDGTSRPERLRHLTGDLTASRGTIDPNGHAVIAINRWLGDLWISRPAAGTRW